MNLVELKTFLTVIDEKGITAASKRLNITQPAITKRLDNLKVSFGINQLLQEKSGELIISKDAQVLVPYAKNIIALIENAQNEVTDHTNGKKGTITIGSGAGWITGILPHAIAKTIDNFLNIHVDFNVDTPDLQLNKLIDNKIDILFARKPENLENFEYKSLRNDKYIVIASKNHPLVNKIIELKILLHTILQLLQPLDKQRICFLIVLLQKIFQNPKFLLRLIHCEWDLIVYTNHHFYYLHKQIFSRAIMILD